MRRVVHRRVTSMYSFAFVDARKEKIETLLLVSVASFAMISS